MCRADRGTHGGDAFGFDLRLISEEIGARLVTKKARRPKRHWPAARVARSWTSARRRSHNQQPAVHGSAKQDMHRHAERLAENVPHGVFDSAEHHDGDAGAANIAREPIAETTTCGLRASSPSMSGAKDLSVIRAYMRV